MIRQQKIQRLLEDNFSIKHIVLENESYMHSVPENSETHFKLVLVSNDFDGVRKVARHQKVYALTNSLMEEGLHALALHLYTVEEWAAHNEHVPSSPNCLGGSKQG